MFSLIFLGLQFTIKMVAPTEYENWYWESWLYYDNHIDKKLPIQKRIEKMKECFPIQYKVGSSYESIGGYQYLLKSKYYSK